MKNVIILHGKQDREEYYNGNTHAPSNGHWMPWLQKQLLTKDVHAHAPEAPNSWMPEYHKWKREIERYDVGEETVLVGHSCGGGFFVRWLSENKDIKPVKVILVAPWIDVEGKIPEQLDMFKFKIDPEITNRTEIVVYYSDNDMSEIDSTIAKLKESIPNAKFIEFKGYGHFCYEDKMDSLEFPELLEEVLA